MADRKRDVTFPQPEDNLVVKWLRIPKSKKKEGKRYLANGSLVDELEEGSFRQGDGKYLAKMILAISREEEQTRECVDHTTMTAV